MRGLGVTETAKKLGVSRDQVHRLERGNRQLTESWAKRLARIYEVAPRDLLSDSGLSVPVKHICGRREGTAGARIAGGDTVGDRYVTAPDYIMSPENTFGFRIFDDHAKGLNLPAGSEGLARPLAKLGRKLKRGDRVIVRRYESTVKQGRIVEELVGLLDRAINGDLLVLIVSDSPEAGPPIVLRRARREDAAGAGAEIEYEPREDDQGEIIGVPITATVPL